MGRFGKYDSAEEIPPEERKYYYVGDKFRAVEEIEFVPQLVNRRWVVVLPKFLAEYHQWWDYWELECHLSMDRHLRPGMLLYDVGAFDGWQSAMFSQMVGGPDNMVLIEPVTEMWANTKATWEKNNLLPPHASFLGFAGDYDTPKAEIAINHWPEGPDYSQMIKAIKFKLMHEHADSTECLKIDTMVLRKNACIRPPNALHIDVEGAGLKVLKGAEHTLRLHRPLVWIALHPAFMRERFKTEPEELHEFMASMGYIGTLLAEDHEQHWIFQ